MADLLTPSTGLVLSDLSKSYGSVHAVRSIDLAIAPGETVAILGPNGAGKTTTIDMILGLTRPDTGHISVFGRSPSDAVAAGAVGGMLQTGSLIPHLNVRELLTMIAALYPRPLEVAEALEISGSIEFADRPTTKLSGGQTQRVRFAMALVANADLMLLDEPTAAVDVEGRRDFWSSMRDIAALGKTVVFATHYLDEADAFADRIVLMARGQIVADGPSTEIKARVGGRTIRATLTEVNLSELGALPGVTMADRHGDSVILSCADSDATLRSLIAQYPWARDIEVHGAGLEEAFMALTADENNDISVGV
jgi:ABC-2 type transport system ATP-binding protein